MNLLEKNYLADYYGFYWAIVGCVVWFLLPWVRTGGVCWTTASARRWWWLDLWRCPRLTAMADRRPNRWIDWPGRWRLGGLWPLVQNGGLVAIWCSLRWRFATRQLGVACADYECSLFGVFGVSLLWLNRCTTDETVLVTPRRVFLFGG